MEDEVKSTVGQSFVLLEIRKKENAKKQAEGACGVLPVKADIKGTYVGRVEGETINFEGTGTLTFAGIEFKDLGKVEESLENGDLLRAGK